MSYQHFIQTLMTVDCWYCSCNHRTGVSAVSMCTSEGSRIREMWTQPLGKYIHIPDNTKETLYRRPRCQKYASLHYSSIQTFSTCNKAHVFPKQATRQTHICLLLTLWWFGESHMVIMFHAAHCHNKFHFLHTLPGDALSKFIAEPSHWY